MRQHSSAQRLNYGLILLLLALIVYTLIGFSIDSTPIRADAQSLDPKSLLDLPVELSEEGGSSATPVSRHGSNPT
jgi:hypothetical protein